MAGTSPLFCSRLLGKIDASADSYIFFPVPPRAHILTSAISNQLEAGQSLLVHTLMPAVVFFLVDTVASGFPFS